MRYESNVKHKRYQIDEKIFVRITELSPEQSQISIRVGMIGNLPESQIILAEIEDIILN